MLFALICTDKPDHLQLRLDNRPAHVDHLKSLGEALKGAGPFLDAEEKPNGSLVIIDVEDRAAAEAVADADPYAKAGLFESVDIRPWSWLINNPETK
jgi:uncharacterized protein YciI